jgi:hypothetical protein
VGGDLAHSQEVNPNARQGRGVVGGGGGGGRSGGGLRVGVVPEITSQGEDSQLDIQLQGDWLLWMVSAQQGLEG